MLSQDVGFEIVLDNNQVILRGQYCGQEPTKLEEMTTALATIGNDLIVRGLCESYIMANVQNCNGTWVYEEVLLRRCEEAALERAIQEYKAVFEGKSQNGFVRENFVDKSAGSIIY